MWLEIDDDEQLAFEAFAADRRAESTRRSAMRPEIGARNVLPAQTSLRRIAVGSNLVVLRPSAISFCRAMLKLIRLCAAALREREILLLGYGRPSQSELVDGT